MIGWLAACVEPEPTAVLAWQSGAGGYVIEARELPELHDVRHMKGEVGSIEYGGYVDVDAGWTGGRELDIRIVVEDGVAVPLDPSGVVLYSFYAHLVDTVAWAELQGFEAEALVPVQIAVNPAVDVLIELTPADNLAYGTGYHTFVILPDGGERDVPLAANLGVVAHEFGHALFHALLSGGPQQPPLVDDLSLVSARWLSSLHEAFADTLGALITDDPAFIQQSIPIDSRDLNGRSPMTSALVPEAGNSPLDLYDPYPLGTVFAGVFWEFRLATDDPARTALLLRDTVERWSPTVDELDGGFFLEAAAAAAGEELPQLCSAITWRFPEADWPGPCRALDASP